MDFLELAYKKNIHILMNICIPKAFVFVSVFSKFSVFKRYIHFLGNSIDISLYLTEKKTKN